MTKLPTDIKPKSAAKALEKLGFGKSKGKGSHVRFRHHDGRGTQIPMHSKPIPKGTLRKILRDADIPLEDFLNQL